MATVASEKMVDPTATPPIAQSMDHNSSKRFCDDSRCTADSPDRPSTSTPSPSRQLDSQSQPSKSEEYRQLFHLPPDEVLIQDFNCALQDNFLLQGHMYVFDHYICFYSNLFGFETKKIIPFHEVTAVRRAKVAAIFPTAIEIIAGEQKYFFTSFLSRDEAFKLINDGWLQPSNGSSEITDHQESMSELSSQENGSVAAETSRRQHVDELQADDERDVDVSLTEDSELPVNGESEILLASSGMQINNVKDVENGRTPECSSAGPSSPLEQEDYDAPGVPECFTMVAESTFPIPVEEFFDLFFSNDAVSFQEMFHRKCGDKDFKCTPWRPNEELGHARDVSFQHPIKLYLGARFGSCREVQKYRVYRDCHLIVETSQEINDVPYGDYFRVEGLWDVQRDNNDSNPGCKLRVYTNVAFSKKTMWKGKIVQSTIDEVREAYATWIDLAHELLRQKNLEKKEVKLQKQASIQKNVAEKASDTHTSRMLPDPEQVNHQEASAPRRNHCDSAVGTLMKDSFAKLSTYLKNQSTPSLLIIITIAVILLLMQISILVLLSRPQRIHVIPQADCRGSLHGISRNGAETFALVGRQFKTLKEEMQIIGTLLEKMQHEHALLKRKLEDLELIRES